MYQTSGASTSKHATYHTSNKQFTNLLMARHPVTCMPSRRLVNWVSKILLFSYILIYFNSYAGYRWWCDDWDLWLSVKFVVIKSSQLFANSPSNNLFVKLLKGKSLCSSIPIVSLTHCSMTGQFTLRLFRPSSFARLLPSQYP